MTKAIRVPFRFNHDYRGFATEERFFTAGEVGQVEAGFATYLQDQGVGVRLDVVDEPAEEDLKKLTIAELRELALDRKVDLSGKSKKADIVAALKAA